MYYLKCKNCGHLNIASSEYLTFCTKCSKKLEDNYLDWIQNNSGKTFHEYQKLVCVSQAEMEANSVKPKETGRIVFISFLSIILFALLFAVGWFASDYVIDYIKYQKTSEEVLKKEWNKEEFGKYGLTIETPIKLTKIDLPFPDNVKQLIENIYTYRNETTRGFQILVSSIKYVPSVGAINLQGAADGSVNEIKMQKGITEFKYEEEAVTRSGFPGFLQHGTFKQDGKAFAFINTGYGQGLNLWQVMTAYRIDDEVGKIAAEKVINSVEINYKGYSKKEKKI